MDDKIKTLLINEAKNAAKSAYCPYSEYAVGAALISSDGRVFSGCNIENASYSLTMCAERVALFKAVSDGVKKISAICVFSDCGKMPYPCGACRQALAEFAEEGAAVIVSDGEHTVETTLEELIPYTFG